jgi:cytochrome c-type biogenesis protein CcmH/NrfF
MKTLQAALVLALVLAADVARAVNPDEVMSDPAFEARARALSSELRCLVCQNESIDDSDATLAHDIRVLGIWGATRRAPAPTRALSAAEEERLAEVTRDDEGT